MQRVMYFVFKSLGSPGQREQGWSVWSQRQARWQSKVTEKAFGSIMH